MPELCVYAVAPGTTGRIEVKGLSGERLRVVRIGGLGVIVGQVRARPSPTDRNLRRYDRTICALWERVTALLPVRFGTSARDADDLSAMIRSQASALQARLRATRNRAQMTVRVALMGIGDRGSGIGDRAVQRSSGTAFLRARADEARRASEVPVFAPLRAAVRRFVREERVEKRGGIASIYHLVPRGSVDRYRSALERAARRANVRLMVSGPWPPYAFAGPA